MVVLFITYWFSKFNVSLTDQNNRLILKSKINYTFAP